LDPTVSSNIPLAIQLAIHPPRLAIYRELPCSLQPVRLARSHVRRWRQRRSGAKNQRWQHSLVPRSSYRAALEAVAAAGPNRRHLKAAVGQIGDNDKPNQRPRPRGVGGLYTGPCFSLHATSEPLHSSLHRPDQSSQRGRPWWTCAGGSKQCERGWVELAAPARASRREVRGQGSRWI
jgi:hypothetical protein